MEIGEGGSAALTGGSADVDMRNPHSRPPPEPRVILSTCMEPKVVAKMVGDLLSSGWSPVEIFHLDASWIPELAHYIHFSNDSPLLLGNGVGRRTNMPPQVGCHIS